MFCAQVATTCVLLGEGGVLGIQRHDAVLATLSFHCPLLSGRLNDNKIQYNLILFFALYCVPLQTCTCVLRAYRAGEAHRVVKKAMLRAGYSLDAPRVGMLEARD